VSTIEVLLGLDTRALAQNSSLVGMSGFNRGILKAVIRIFTVLVFVGIAIVFPSFDRIMTLLGSVCCFTICIILPIAFHLKLFGKEIGRTEKVVNWVLIVVSSVMAIVSTVFACLPKDLIGA
jgi:vesicular inhibitory amino acid transporter